MAKFDAERKSNNGTLSQLDIMKGKSILIDSKTGDLVFKEKGVEVRLVGKFKLNDKGTKIKSGTLDQIIVKKDGKLLYKITEIDKKVMPFLEAGFDGTIQSYIPKLFDGKDTIWGSAFNDKLYGFKGKDEINGWQGDDIIYGGKGNDKLWGYTGKDAFVFDTALNPKTNVDTIMDWNTLKNQPKKGAGADSIWLDSKIFKGFADKKGERLKNDDFVVGNKATGDSAQIIYNKSNGKLFYDPDGADGNSKILFAKIANTKKVVADDFLII